MDEMYIKAFYTKRNKLAKIRKMYQGTYRPSQFGKKYAIIDRRLSLGLTREHVAAVLGISVNSYISKEEGHTIFNERDLVLLSHLLDMSINDMLDDDVII